MNLPVKEIGSISALFVVAMVRIAAALAIAPFCSQQFVSGTGRRVVTFALALPLFYLIYPTLPSESVTFMILGVVLIKEAIIGAVLGFCASFIFYVAEGVGFVVDVQRGASMATIFDPMAGAQTSLMGSCLLQMMSVAFFSGGGFLCFLDLIYHTYKMWPVFFYIPSVDGGFAVFFIEMVNASMEVMFCLAAPILIVLFLAEFGLGMVNRFAPQLNVFFLSMPIKSWLSMMFILMYLSLLGHFFKKYFTVESKLLEFINIFVGR